MRSASRTTTTPLLPWVRRSPTWRPPRPMWRAAASTWPMPGWMRPSRGASASPRSRPVRWSRPARPRPWPPSSNLTQSTASLLQLKQALARGDFKKAGATAAKVRLQLEDGSAYPLEGRLEFSDVTVDQGTGSITLRAVFPNPKADLLPGMYVRAVLQEGVKESGLLIPQQAVTRDGAGKPVAYVVGKDNKLERRALETDRAIGDQWLVRRGLSEGEQLVVDGLQRAAPGIEVKTEPWAPKAKPAAAGAPASASASAAPTTPTAETTASAR